MALQGSGAITLAQIATEFGGAAPHSLSEYYRGGSYVGAGAPNVPTSGAISFSHFYGGSASFYFSQGIASNTANYRLHDALIAAGWNGVTPVNATISVNPGVYVYESGLGNWAMIIGHNNNTTFPAGSTVTLYVYGTIIGQGGNGGIGGLEQWTGQLATAGQAGGHALLVYTPVTIYNYGAIYGGGGGAGGQYLFGNTYYNWEGGGGGGGGAGYIGGTGGLSGYGTYYNGAYSGVAWGQGFSGSTLTGGASGGNSGSEAAFGAYAASFIGHGGNAGQSGVSSITRGIYPGAASGGPGYYVYNNGYITWAVTGTRVGLVA